MGGGRLTMFSSCAEKAKYCVMMSRQSCALLMAMRMESESCEAFSAPRRIRRAAW